MTRARPRRLLLCALLLLPGLAAGGETPDPADALAAVVRNPATLTGEPEEEARFWLERALEAPGSPAAALALRLVAAAAERGLPRPGQFEQSLRRYLAADEAGGPAADTARRLLTAWACRRGDFAAGRALAVEAGCLLDWRVIGPFGHYANANFTSRFAPERGLSSLDEALPGARGPVRWRPLAPHPLTQELRPYDRVYPREGGVVYLLTQIRLSGEAPRPAALHIDSGACWALWLNGRQTLVTDRLGAYFPRERYAPITLQPGWNTVLLKLYSIGQETELRVRLADPRGRPLHPAEVRAGPDLHPSAAPAAPPAQRVPWALPLLQELRGRDDAAATAAAALALQYRQQFVPDRAREAAETALAAAPEDARYLLLAARAAHQAHHLPAEVRVNETRRYLRRLRGGASTPLPALLLEAELQRDDQRPRAAVETLRQALAAAPQNLPALALRAEIGLAEPWMDPPQAWVKAVAEAHPHTRTAALLEARAASAERRAAAAAAAYERARTADQSSLDLWLADLEARTRIGDEEGAALLVARLEELLPGDARVLARLADHHVARGALEAAAEAIARACEALPTDETLWHRRLEILLLADRREEAAEAGRRSLELAPEQHNLRRLLAELSGGSYDFWSAYAQNPLRALLQSDRQAHAGSTVRLIDQTVMQIYPDGSRAESIHQLQKVLNDSGVNKARQVPLFGEILQARTILPGGQTWEPLRLSDQNHLTMPNLRPGAAVEYRFLMKHGARYDYGMHGPGWYFRSPDSHEEFVLSQYIIRVPKDFPFVYVQRNFATPPQITEEGPYRVYAWTLRNMERVWEEENTPHINEFLPYVEIGSATGWDDIANVLRNAYRGHIRPTVELRRLVKRLVGHTDDPRERLEILYRHVLDKVERSRIGGGATVIWSRRSGSRLLLLLALLRQAGLDARFAALRPHADLLYDANWELPQADHLPLRGLAVFLPEAEAPVWLDVRYRPLTPGQLLEDFSGATAFVLGAEGGRFHTLPRRPAEAFGIRETRRLVLDPESGGGRVEGRRLLRGVRGMDHKENLPALSRRDQIRLLERRLGEAFPLVTATTFETPDLETPGTPYEEVYAAEVERLVVELGRGRLATGLGLAPLELVPDLQSDPAERRNPYRIQQFHVGDETVRLQIPDGYLLQEPPADLYLKDFFGHYRLRIRRRDAEVVVHRAYSFTPRFIARNEYAALVAMARRIRAAERAQLVFLPARPEPSPAPPPGAPARRPDAEALARRP